MLEDFSLDLFTEPGDAKMASCPAWKALSAHMDATESATNSTESTSREQAGKLGGLQGCTNASSF